jgi:MSHA pilin protein MshD
LRYTSPRFDNVSDYNGYCMGSGCGIDATIVTASGATVAGLENYRTDVSVAQSATNEVGPALPDTEGLLITVTTQHVPTATTVSLQSYRVRYAPNSP